MNNRQRMLSILNYGNPDGIPVVCFGYWSDTLQKWVAEGHITQDEADNWGDGNEADKSIAAKLGFDFGYSPAVGINADIVPLFEAEVIETLADGTRMVRDGHGNVHIEKEGAGSIPAEVDHTLKGRKEWDELFLPRLQFDPIRATVDQEMIDYINDPARAEFAGLHTGSLFGTIRNWLGLENTAYLYADDPDLFVEIIDTVGNLCFQCTEHVLKQVSGFDFGHFWEDICFKSGPLINPGVFDKYVGPHYKRITDLLRAHGIEIVSLDCDGKIDALIPTWLHNGVNTMFPIEVGTWNASIEPWRGKYGKELRGVGGMNKTVFAHDRSAIDAEIERLVPLVELGGFVPCPDHRIAPDAKWENVQYYCDKMRQRFCP
jgi:hypothetical protein